MNRAQLLSQNQAMRPLQRQFQRGFTLIELVIVIVIAGILAAVIALAMGFPVNSYLQSSRRAQLSDVADSTMRRMVRDFRLALPNSLRIRDSAGNIGSCSSGTCYMEFITTSGGGRYRSEGDGSTAGNILSFSSGASKVFDVLGTMPSNPAMAANDYIVVYNLGPGYAPANAYDCSSSCNRAQIAGISGNAVTLVSNPFSSQVPSMVSPGARFQVVPAADQAVTYSCPLSTAGNVVRYSGYGFLASQPAPPSGGNSGLLVNGTATCNVDYTSSDGTGRNGLLSLTLTLTLSSGESAALFQQVHVSNAP